jgi:serine O-acetyltransferase
MDQYRATVPAESDIAGIDPVWSKIRGPAANLAAAEPILASLLYATVLNQPRFEDALSYHLAQKIGTVEAPAILIRQVLDEAFSADRNIGVAARADIVAVHERDPACKSHLDPFMWFKGFHALQTQRVAHWLWQRGREGLALFLQSRSSSLFGVDIHPAARMGKGIMIDHATGVVIGETAMVEDGVSMLHGVTLGGTGKKGGDRHPKVRRGVLIGAGATILGNIEIGACAKVAAGSVVLHDVPAGCTVAGVPAKVIGCVDCPEPALEMDHRV